MSRDRSGPIDLPDGLADTARHASKADARAWRPDEDVALQAIVDGLGEELREQFNTVTDVTEQRSN